MTNSTSIPANAQHSLTKSFLLHISPGILVTLAFFLLNRLLGQSGFPPLLAFLLAILLTDIPFMLGVMLTEGKKLNGRFGLDGIVLYRQKVDWKTFRIIFVVAFMIAYLLFMLVTPISNYMKQGIFSSLPEWIFLEEQAQYVSYNKNILTFVFSLQLAITGIALPWVEELYFRGYLLPRISRFERWAPLMGGLLFGMYHIWQLFDFPTVFLLGLVLGYVVWWKKDIRLSIVMHVFANALGRLTFLLAVLSM